LAGAGSRSAAIIMSRASPDSTRKDKASPPRNQAVMVRSGKLLSAMVASASAATDWMAMIPDRRPDGASPALLRRSVIARTSIASWSGPTAKPTAAAKP
jgi:hypothetical protein